MSHPVEGGGDPGDHRRPEEQPQEGFLAGRSVVPNPNMPTARRVSALGYLPGQAEMIQDVPDLSEKDEAAGALICFLYKPDMNPMQRFHLLRLVTEHGEEFLATITPLARDLSGSDAFDLYQTVSEHPTKWAAIQKVVYGEENGADILRLTEAVISAREHAEELLFESDDADTKYRLLIWIPTTSLSSQENLAICRGLLTADDPIAERQLKVLSMNEIPAADRAEFVRVIQESSLQALAVSFSTTPRERWEQAIHYASEVTSGNLFVEAAKILITLPDSTTIIATYRVLVSELMAESDRLDLLEEVIKYKPEVHDAAYFARGDGSLDEKMELLQYIIDLTPEKRAEFFPFMTRLTSLHTPVRAVSDLVKALNVGKTSRSRIIKLFIAGTQDGLPSFSISISRDRNITAQVLAVLHDQGAKQIHWGFEGSPGDHTKEILREAIAGIRAHFDSILEETADGLVIRPESDPKLVKNLGNMLYALAVSGIRLPEDFLLAGSLFHDLERLPENALTTSSDLLSCFAQTLTNFGNFKPSALLRSLLCTEPLPPPPKERNPGQLVRRVSDLGAKEIQRLSSTQSIEVPEDVVMLFRDDQEIAQGVVEEFAGIDDRHTLFRRASFLFTDHDSAQQRLTLVQSIPLDVPEEQVKAAGFLILESDSVEQRLAILKEVEGKEIPPGSYPFLPEDPPNARLLLIRLLNNKKLRDAAALFPLMPGTKIMDRFGMIKGFASLEPARLPENQREALVRLLLQSPRGSITKVLGQLQELSSDSLAHHLALPTDDLEMVLRFSERCTDSENQEQTARIRKDIESDIAAGRLSTIELAASTFSINDNASSCAKIYELMRQMPHPEILANYLSGYDFISSNRSAFITALHSMPADERDWLMNAISKFSFSSQVLKLIALPHADRVKAFERLEGLLSAEDSSLSRLFIFELICNLPSSEQEKACSYIKKFLHFEDSSERRELLFLALRNCASAAKVGEVTASFYQQRLFSRYFELLIHAMSINEGDVLPQLDVYINNPIQRKLYIVGGEAVDEGGPSREVLSRARAELHARFQDLFTQSDGLYSIKPAEGVLSDEGARKAASFGRLLFLMSMLGVPMPPDMQLDPADFDAMAEFSQHSLRAPSLELRILARGNDLSRMQRLFEKVYAYEIKKFGVEAFEDYLQTAQNLIDEIDEEEPGLDDDTRAERLDAKIEDLADTLKRAIRSRETRFQVARGLSREGKSVCRAITARLLAKPPPLRPILQDPAKWDFSGVEGDKDLQIAFFQRWVNEASEEQLQRLVFSMAGTETLVPGKVLIIHTGNVAGPFPHTCTFEMDMPLIPTAEDLEGLDEEIAAKQEELQGQLARLVELEQSQAAELAALRARGPGEGEVEELIQSHVRSKALIEDELAPLRELEQYRALGELRDYERFKELMDQLPTQDTSL